MAITRKPMSKRRTRRGRLLEKAKTTSELLKLTYPKALRIVRKLGRTGYKNAFFNLPARTNERSVDVAVYKKGFKTTAEKAVHIKSMIANLERLEESAAAALVKCVKEKVRWSSEKMNASDSFAAHMVEIEENIANLKKEFTNLTSRKH